MNKKIRIGAFRLGHEDVELIALTGDKGGDFYFVPEAGHIGRIRVGLDYEKWDGVVSVLLHETLEYLMLRSEKAHISTGSISRGIDNRLFIINHYEFSEMCVRAAEFLTDAVPKLAAVYAKSRKKA